MNVIWSVLTWVVFIHTTNMSHSQGKSRSRRLGNTSVSTCVVTSLLFPLHPGHIYYVLKEQKEKNKIQVGLSGTWTHVEIQVVLYVYSGEKMNRQLVCPGEASGTPLFTFPLLFCLICLRFLLSLKRNQLMGP